MDRAETSHDRLRVLALARNVLVHVQNRDLEGVTKSEVRQGFLLLLQNKQVNWQLFDLQCQIIADKKEDRSAA